MRTAFWAVLAACFFFTGCLGLQRKQPLLKTEDPQPAPDMSWEILDYQNKNVGMAIPEWVSLYLQGKGSQIENLPEFKETFIFVSANTGTSFSALRQWNAAFSPGLDFARLAAMRIEKRLLDAAISYPDDEYGGYFETLVRAASDAEWTGAEKRKDFWLYRSFPDPENPGLSRENFDFLILVTVDRDLLALQIKTLMGGIVTETPLSREQRNAVNKIQEKFFDAF